MTRFKKRLISIGVDPGTKNGAIAIINCNDNGDTPDIVQLMKAPYISEDIKSKQVKRKLNKETMKYEKAFKQKTRTDFKAMRDIFLPYIKDDVIFTVEKASVRSEEGENISFINGNTLGIYEGQYSLLNPIAFYEPSPQVWKKEMKVTSEKSSSIIAAEELYNCNLRNYVKRGKLDDIAEALLLAWYGLRMYYYNEIE